MKNLQSFTPRRQVLSLVKTPQQGVILIFPPFWPQADGNPNHESRSRRTFTQGCSSDPALLTRWSWSPEPRPGILSWNQTTVVTQQSQTLCSLIITHWLIYGYFVFSVRTCSCGWKPCFHGRCSLPFRHQGLLFMLLENLPHSVKTANGDHGCLHRDIKLRDRKCGGSCQYTLIFCHRESVWKWGLMLLAHWSHQLCCRFIVSIYLNNLCDIALVYLLCFSHACLKSNMSFANLWCFAAYLNVTFPHFLGWGILNIWCFVRGKTSFISS